jgi:hypothetical protein
MARQTHRRQEEWEGWPFRSVVDAAEFIGELLAMVEEAAGSAPHLSASVTFADRKYEMQSLGELREAAPGFRLGDMYELSAMIFWAWGESQTVTANFNLVGGAYQRSTRLSVDGTKATAVDGVNVGAVAAVSRWAERTKEKEEAEKAAAENKAEPVRPTPMPPPDPTPAPDPQPVWRRLVAHPYTVQIIGGVVAGMILLVIAAVAFSQG